MPDALTRLLLDGQAALERDDRAGAVTAFTAACDLAPGEVSVALALSNAHRLSGDALMTRATLLRAYAVASAAGDATLYALGAALLEAGSPVEAVECFARVVKTRPREPAALAALAGAMRTMGDAAGAWPVIHRAIASAPDHPAVLVTASQIRHDLGDLRGALRFLDRADATRPDHAPTQLLRAYTMMMEGPTAVAWAQFEARPLPVPPTGAQPWHGESRDSLEGTSVLVTAEQGVGDQFQFLRFLRELRERRAARVFVECHADAVSLLQSNGIEAVTRNSSHEAASGHVPETEWHVPLLSLPHRLGLGSEVGADSVPYLRASPSEAARAAAVLPSRDESRPLRLGLVWAGNPSFPGRVTRDLDAARLPEIVAIPGVQWIALQHGLAGEVEVPGLERVPLPGDWAATAGMLATLDGLVSTDTGIVHLAGAMGVRTWTLLQKTPDWRWGLSGTGSAWYPRMTLVRQGRSRDWTGVVEELRGLLAV